MRQHNSSSEDYSLLCESVSCHGIYVDLWKHLFGRAVGSDSAILFMENPYSGSSMCVQVWTYMQRCGGGYVIQLALTTDDVRISAGRLSYCRPTRIISGVVRHSPTNFQSAKIKTHIHMNNIYPIYIYRFWYIKCVAEISLATDARQPHSLPGRYAESCFFYQLTKSLSPLFLFCLFPHFYLLYLYCVQCVMPVSVGSAAASGTDFATAVAVDAGGQCIRLRFTFCWLAYDDQRKADAFSIYERVTSSTTTKWCSTAPQQWPFSCFLLGIRCTLAK